MTKLYTGATAGRFLKSLGVAKGDEASAVAYAESQAWNDRADVVTALKAAVAPMTVSGQPDLTTGTVAADFLAVLRPASIISRLDRARRVRPNIRVATFTNGATGYRVGEGQPKPVSADVLKAQIIRTSKHVGQIVVSNELLRLAVPGADEALTADVSAAVGAAEDASFIDPTSIISLLHGTTPVASTGTGLAAVDTDLAALIAKLIAGGSSLTAAMFVMNPTTANALAQLRGSGGAPAFPNITAFGGTLLGLPVLTSKAVQGYIALLDQAGILIADDGVSLDSSTEADIELDDSPADAPNSSTVKRSLWQLDMIALRAEVYRGWLARDGAAAFISGVTF